jgi:hypothetical protein
MSINNSEPAATIRGFTILSQSWYANPKSEQLQNGGDELHVAYYSPDGVASEGFSVSWRTQDGNLSVQLNVPENSWSALARFSDVFQRLGRLAGTTPSVEAVVDVLSSCGMEDRTERTMPASEELRISHDNAIRLAKLTSIYQDSLNRLRELGRTEYGVEGWAEKVEFGTPVTAVQGIPRELHAEMVQAAKITAQRRQQLTEILDKLDDNQLIAAYRHLVNFEFKPYY